MEERFKNILNWKNVLRGSILFFMFTIIGLLTSSLWKGSKDAVSILRSIDFRFLAVMFLLIFVDWVLMGYRVFIFASRMSDRVSFWGGFLPLIWSYLLEELSSLLNSEKIFFRNMEFQIDR